MKDKNFLQIFINRNVFRPLILKNFFLMNCIFFNKEYTIFHYIYPIKIKAIDIRVGYKFKSVS